MDSSRSRPWLSLWFTALGSFIAQLALCQFFSLGQRVPISIDVDPSNMWKYAYHFPPRGEFLVLNWFGVANLPPTLNPFSLAASHFSVWFFFTTYAPFIGTMALLAMAAFLRELELPRPAALFGGVIYAWQGDLLPFVFPGHYGYITTWPFFAIAAWGALRAQRTRQWAYSVMSGASCGMMVGLQPDRGAIASLLIAALYLAPALNRRALLDLVLENKIRLIKMTNRFDSKWIKQSISRVLGIPRNTNYSTYQIDQSARICLVTNVRQLVLCAGLALLISLAGFLALFQSYIVGVNMGTSTNREETFNMATQYSLGPAETLTYLAPGVFGWSSSNADGPYWGWIGETPGWEKTHQGTRNLNLAISTTGTVATMLALLGACLLLPGRIFAGAGLSERQIYFGRLFLIAGGLALLLAWGYHTPLYRPLFALPLMDKWRNPLKWLGITNFALVTLSAFGVQALVRSLTTDGQSLRRPLQIFFAVMIGLLGIGFFAGYPVSIIVATHLSDAGYEPPSISNAMHTLHVALGFAWGLSGGAWLLLLGAWRAERLRQWKVVNPWLAKLWNRMLSPDLLPMTLAVALALLGVLQLKWVATQFIQPVGLAQLTATNSLLEALRAEGPAVRVAVPPPQDVFLNVYLQNQFAADRISSVDISAASRIPDDLAAFLGALAKDPVRLWFLAGVKNVAVAQQDVAQMHQNPDIAAAMAKADGYTVPEAGTGDEPSHALVGLRDYLAKATFVPSAEIIFDDHEMLKRIADPKWNPRASILLSAPDDHGTSAKTAPAQVTLSTYTPHEIDVAVDTPSAGYILINDQYSPDWEVEVNGKPGKLLRADYLLRAIPVDEGTSRIVLRYVAHYRVEGLAIPVVAMNLFSDGVMLAAWLVAGLALWRSRKVADARRIDSERSG